MSAPDRSSWLYLSCHCDVAMRRYGRRHSPSRCSTISASMRWSCSASCCLTGVGGLTSFGQAAFVGIGAYATGWLTTAHGASPWLGLLFALALTGRRGAPRRRDAAARRTLPAARHHRLGHVDLLFVRQHRRSRRTQRHDRRAADLDRLALARAERGDLLFDLGLLALAMLAIANLLNRARAAPSAACAAAP